MCHFKLSKFTVWERSIIVCCYLAAADFKECNILVFVHIHIDTAACWPGAEKPTFDARCKIYELDPCDGFGKVCLVYKESKTGEPAPVYLHVSHTVKHSSIYCLCTTMFHIHISLSCLYVVISSIEFLVLFMKVRFIVIFIFADLDNISFMFLQVHPKSPS